MAITKLTRLKESPGKNRAEHLKNNLFYICNPDKCRGGVLIGGNAGITPEIIYQTMIENKKLWGKEDGSQGFHYVISFPPELNVSEETAYIIAEEFVQELLGDRFFYAFAVHNDQHHMHVHITFDSVSKEDGYKYHSPKGDWEKKIQPITDRICRRHGLPPLEFSEERKGKNYGQWAADQEPREEKQKAEKFNWYDLIRDDIDLAIGEADSYEAFLRILSERGYEIREGKYLSLRPYGKERSVRSSRLGSGYSIEEIKMRIEAREKKYTASDYPRYGNEEVMKAFLLLRVSKAPGWKMTPFQRAYYRRWHNSFLRNKPGRPDPWKINEDVIRVRRLSDAIKYMVDNEIGNMDDLEEKWQQLEKEKKALVSERSAVRTKLNRNAPYRELADYEKLKSEMKKDPSEEIKKQMDLLFAKITEKMGFEEAVEKRDSLREQADLISERLKEIRQREKTMSDIYTFYFEMPAPSAEKDRIPDPGIRRQEPWKDMDKNRPRTRVTIHKSLIRDEDNERYYVKVPGISAVMEIPRKDCFLYKSGEILSAFLYDDEDYTVRMKQDEEQTKPGSEMKAFFKKQKDRYNEISRERKAR